MLRGTLQVLGKLVGTLTQEDRLCGSLTIEGRLVGTIEEAATPVVPSTTFVGWSVSPGPYVAADILSLNELSSVSLVDGLFQVSLNPVNGYLVAAYLDAFNGAVETDFLVGSFLPGGANEVQSGLLISGQAYTVARSNAPQLYSGLNWQRVIT